MRLLEPLYYESLPYLYAGLALFSFSHSGDSKAACVAAFLLAFSSGYILKKRYEYRTNKGRFKKI